MRPEASGFRASPLTVWVGSARFDFSPGRDVIVGYGPGSDIALERLGTPTSPPPAPRPEVVLRFAGTHWVAIDLSHNGIFVDGARASTVAIRNGQAISVGDPQRGPRLVFEIAHPAGPPRQTPPRPPAYPPRQPPAPPPFPPPPAHPGEPSPLAPTERETQRMRVVPPQPPAAERPAHPQPTPPIPPPVEPIPAADAQAKAPGLIERMITSKLRVPRAAVGAAESGNATYRLPLKAEARTLGVTAYQLGLTVDGRDMLSGISFSARPGMFTVVVGPSANRNSALLGLLAGTRQPSSGRVTVDGHDVHAEPASMRTRIGIVSPEDRLHRQLTVEKALAYAAELRLPQDVSPEQRDRVIGQVLEELDLSEHRSTRIGKLSPEVRRCAALAVELLTRPTLLVVDEPTAGLDAEQQRHVMAMLRRQADIGCVVVAAVSSPTSLANLDLCDEVLTLTSAGTTAFLGPPAHVESALGTADWPQVLARVSADPDGVHRAFRARPPAAPAPPEIAPPTPPPAEAPLGRQIRLLARRDVRLLFADRLYVGFLVLLSFALAGLTLLIPGDSGLTRPRAGDAHPHEAIEILAALNLAAVIIGTALTIRTVVREHRIFRREQALGLSTVAYLAAKILVFSLAAAILTAIVFAIVIADKGGPAGGAALLHNATLELYMSVAVTAIVSAAVGLALSTMGKSLREVLPLLLPVILASALFNGSLVQLVSKWGLQQISWFVPARWGFAASASTANLRRVDPLAADCQTWTHYSGWWLFDITMLFLLGVAAAGFTLYRLRPREPHIANNRN
ncbi:ABC transporter [Mycobacterium sp. E3298]|uniref:ATP-binding cassette domain-containing protein n=1 Tax=unclassified Mycobacterium TaxID=2642494 RepID=UPI0007FBEB02|nr:MULTISPECIES: ATP-binding cassette domain-containing protein [unclassified Mycobacterium]OBG54785.1 ABC transporter [Mycobacterium sp. E188]OBG82704.1 ABC transporter [Mycobacterium sp. E3298]OBH39362.1 ABC transporter [Mycobacterium sp. E183]